MNHNRYQLPGISLFLQQVIRSLMLVICLHKPPIAFQKLPNPLKQFQKTKVAFSG